MKAHITRITVPFLILLLTLSLLSFSTAFAEQLPTLVVYPSMGGAAGSSAAALGSGSWQAIPGKKAEAYLTPAMLGLPADLKISQIKSISYKTKVGATQLEKGNPDLAFGLNIYTAKGASNNDGSWYGHRLNAEPYFSIDRSNSTTDWNAWSTDQGQNQLRLYDANHGVYGTYNDPTLALIQAGNVNWKTFDSAYAATDIDYAGQTVLYFTPTTGSSWTNFDGNLDALTIETTDGKVATVDFENLPASVSVNAAWTQTSVIPGHIFGSDAFNTIQAGIDAVAPDGAVLVYPGSYNETAANRSPATIPGAYQFGLFVGVDKSGITVQGVDADGAPISDYTKLAASVATNATNNFGYDGIFVEGDHVTFAGLRILPNLPSDNKTFEVVGDAFTLKDSHIDIPGGGSLYFDDNRFQNNVSHVQSYTIQHNWFDQGASVDVTSGAGFSGPASGRVIANNLFEGDGADWALISFRGSGGRDWYVNPVGGAVITGNTFSASTQYIRATGVYVENQFDWAAYWNGNTFDKAVVTGTDLPASPRAYAYDTFTNARRIGGTIQGEVDDAQAGDTVLAKPGAYIEQVVIAKSLKLQGLDKATTIVQAPATLPDASKPESAILRVMGATTQAEITGLTIAGPGPSTCGSIRAGIYVSDAATATIHDNLVKDIRDAFSGGNLSGCQNGVGIAVGRQAWSTTGTATIQNNVIQGYQKGGIVIDNAGSSATISGNTVTGVGATAFIAQNGIQISRGAVASVTNNTVSGNQCNHASCGPNLLTQDGSAGILLYYPGAGTTLSANTVSSNDLGIVSMLLPSVSGVTFSQNRLDSNRYAGIYAGEGSLSLSENEITGSGNIGVALVSFKSDQGNAAASLSKNLIDGPKTGIQLLQESGSTYHPVLTANLNSIHAATTGLDNQTTVSVDATQNWWQSQHGPKAASISGGDGQTAQGLASLSPWLCDGVDAQPSATGFQHAAGPFCTAAPTRLVFSAQPGTSVVDLLLDPQPILRAEDDQGNLGVNFSGKVLLSFGANPGGASLSGTILQSFKDGLATFSDLKINQIGSGYILVAQSSPTLSFAVTTPFDVVPPSADLALSQDAPANATAGSPVTLTLHLSNLGPQTAESVKVVDTLPAGSTLVSATGTGWSCTNASGVVTCQRASLAKGAAPDISLVIKAPAAAGTVANAAAASSSTDDAASDNNQTSVNIKVVIIPVTGGIKLYLPLVNQ